MHSAPCRSHHGSRGADSQHLGAARERFRGANATPTRLSPRTAAIHAMRKETTELSKANAGDLSLQQIEEGLVRDDVDDVTVLAYGAEIAGRDAPFGESQLRRELRDFAGDQL